MAAVPVRRACRTSPRLAPARRSAWPWKRPRAVHHDRQRSGHPELPGSGYLDQSTLRIRSRAMTTSSVHTASHHAAQAQGTRPDRPRRTVRRARRRADLPLRGRRRRRAGCAAHCLRSRGRHAVLARVVGEPGVRGGGRPAGLRDGDTHRRPRLRPLGVQPLGELPQRCRLRRGGGRRRRGRTLAGAADHHRPPDPRTVGRGAAADERKRWPRPRY